MFGHNRGLGLFSNVLGGQGGLGGTSGLGGTPGESLGGRQLTLVAAEGFSGNGMATIGGDNTFSLLAHLPPTSTMSPYSPAVYAAYLVDSRGQNGFYAGTLRPAGNGMFQTQFRSPVPLVHFDKVVVSMESPQRIAQAPQGPIVMMVKSGGLLAGLAPVKKIGGNAWGKVKGFIGNRFGGKEEQIPQEQYPQQQYPQQQYPQQQYPQQQYPQQYSQQQYPPRQYPAQPYPAQQYRPQSPPQQYVPQQYSGQQAGYQQQGGYVPPVNPAPAANQSAPASPSMVAPVPPPAPVAPPINQMQQPIPTGAGESIE